MNLSKGDRAYWKPLRVEVFVDEVRPDGSFRIMEILPEPMMWDAKAGDLVKQERDRMTRVKIEPGEMATYRRFNSEVQKFRQHAVEALHMFTWNRDALVASELEKRLLREARTMRAVCQAEEVFMEGLEEKYKFDRRDSIVLDLWTDEIGVQKAGGP